MFDRTIVVSRRPRALALAATLGMLCAATSFAADAPVEPPKSAEKAPRASALADTSKPVLFLQETVITGARYPREYFRSPQALSFVSRRQLLDQAPTTVSDVLSRLPGVDASKDSPWEQRPVLRGLSGQRVLVLVDGSPMNSARGNGPHPSLVDPEQVERIEVVRGPSSVAYGSDALGGVINIITREAPPAAGGISLRGSASIGGSTADRQRNGYLELVPRIGKLSAFLSSGGRRAENFEAPDGEVPNSSFRDYNALFNVRYDFTDRLALKTGYQLYRGHDIGIPGLSFAMPGATQDFDFTYYDRDVAHVTLDRGFPQSWIESAHFKTYWQRERRNFFSDQVLSSAMAGAFGVPPRTGASNVQTLQDRFFDVATYGVQLQATSRKTERYRMTAGIDAARDRTDGDNVRYRTYYDASGNQVLGPGGSPATAVRITTSIPDGSFDNLASYVQSEWFLHPQWTANAGGRLTHYRYRTESGISAPAAGPTPAQTFDPHRLDENATAASLGIVYEPKPALHLTANVANGYRQPNAQDLFFNGAASVGFVVGNPSLEAEKSISYDLGLRWGPGALAFSGNLFYTTFDNLIDAIVQPAAPGAPPGPATYQYVNISEARMWGGEAEAEWRFAEQWTARAAAAGSIGDITSSSAIQGLYGVTANQAPLPNVPPFKGTASVRWRDRSGRFWVEPSLRGSWRTNRLPLPTPGVSQLTDFKKEWIVGDVFAGARLSSGQRLVLGVRNVANTTYRQPLASLEDPGFSVVGSLSTDF